jgi:hypothetical protein
VTSRYLVPLLCIASLFAQAGPDVTKLIDTYCSGSHNGSTRSPSGTLLAHFDPTQISANPDLWSRAYRQLEAGTMPPFRCAPA